MDDLESFEEKRLTYAAMSVYKEPFFTAVASLREEFLAVAVYYGKVLGHTLLEYLPETHQRDGEIWTEIRYVAVPDKVAASRAQLPWQEARGYWHRDLAWGVPESVPRTKEMFDWWLNTVIGEAADFESLDGKTMKDAVKIVKPRQASFYKP